jgi:hypothetical protein
LFFPQQNGQRLSPKESYTPEFRCCVVASRTRSEFAPSCGQCAQNLFGTCRRRSIADGSARVPTREAQVPSYRRGSRECAIARKKSGDDTIWDGWRKEENKVVVFSWRNTQVESWSGQVDSAIIVVAVLRTERSSLAGQLVRMTSAGHSHGDFNQGGGSDAGSESQTERVHSDRF